MRNKILKRRDIMKFKLKDEEINALIECFDVALKEEGKQLLNSFKHLYNTLNNPIEVNEEENYKIYSFNEQEIEVINHVFHLTLLETGWKGFHGVAQLDNVFQNPIDEDKKED
jgi:hypothetical protein